MNRIDSEKSFKLVLNLDVILALLFLVVPMISYTREVLHNYTFTFPVFILWLVVIGFNQRKLGHFFKILNKRKSEFFFLLLFIFFLVFDYFFRGNNSTSFNHMLTFVNIFFILLMDSYYTGRGERYRKTIFFLIVIFLGIQAAVSVPYFLSSGFNVARQLTASRLEEELSLDAIKHGVGGSSLYLSLIPLSILAFSKAQNLRDSKKYILICSIIIILISVLLAAFSTPIVMLAGALLFLGGWYFKHLVNRKVFLYVSFFAVGMVLFYNKYLDESSLLEPIFQRITWLMEGEGGSLSAREDFLGNSLNTFVHNPFFGVGILPLRSYELIGGHAFWFDFLGYLGFFGFLPFLLFIVVLIKKNWHFYFKKDSEHFYRICCLLGVIIFILSNNVTTSFSSQLMQVLVFFFCTSSANYLKNT